MKSMWLGRGGVEKHEIYVAWVGKGPRNMKSMQTR